MPGPFEQPEGPNFDRVTAALEKGSRAQQVLGLGVGLDLDRRRLAILETAENELRGGFLTPDRAFMHIACANALRRYHQELKDDVTAAQKAAEELHAQPDDGDSPAAGE